MARGWAKKDDIPTFILEHEGRQVGVAHGSNCYIMMIQSFDENKGHGTKFIELWEKYACAKGCSQLEVSPIANDKLEHILEKQGFFLKEKDHYGEKVYVKKCPE